VQSSDPIFIFNPETKTVNHRTGTVKSQSKSFPHALANVGLHGDPPPDLSLPLLAPFSPQAAWHKGRCGRKK
jgi:hypothetical protein